MAVDLHENWRRLGDALQENWRRVGEDLQQNWRRFGDDLQENWIYGLEMFCKRTRGGRKMGKSAERNFDEEFQKEANWMTSEVLLVLVS